MNKCLICYQPLEEGLSYHPKCSKKLFGTAAAPILDYSLDQMLDLGENVLRSQKTVTGVQPKLSLGIEKHRAQPDRFTIVGLWGQYILKPPSPHYANLPENEDLTMQLAEQSGIETVPHGLIPLKSGELAYITKRIDRTKAGKLHMEDGCQLTEKLTEQKYNGSHEQLAKALLLHTEYPVLDVSKYYEVVLFCFLTGNSDMHLKNFSIIRKEGRHFLSPAYDLLSTKLALPEDDEDLALMLNGRKKKLKRRDFVAAMTRADISEKAIEHLFNKYATFLPDWKLIIANSFLPKGLQQEYTQLIEDRFNRLNLL